MLKKVLYILGFFLVLAYLVAAIVYFSDYSDSTRCSGLEVRVEGKTKHAFMQKVDVERDLKRLGFTPMASRSTLSIFTEWKETFVPIPFSAERNCMPLHPANCI